MSYDPNDPMNNPAWSLPPDYRDLRGSDAWQALMLGPRRGDLGVLRHYNSNARWGSTVRLDPIGTPSFPGRANPVNLATLIDTDDYPSNIPIAYQLRFALSPSGPFTAEIPAGADSGARLSVLKSLDMKAGGAEEVSTLTPGNSQPSCTLITRKLTVTIANLSRFGGVDPGDNVTLFVQAAACPVTMVDCRDVVPSDTTGGYDTALETFLPVSTDTITLLAANPLRKQFVIQNLSTIASMIVRFGEGATFTGEGGPLGTFILPADTTGVYESPVGCYRGIVTAQWNTTDDAGGGALITEGT